MDSKHKIDASSCKAKILKLGKHHIQLKRCTWQPN